MFNLHRSSDTAFVFAPAVLLAIVGFFSIASLAQAPKSVTTSSGKWNLVWSDEFDGQNGSAPDAAKWTVENSGKWANNELQYYTARPQNVQIVDNTLVITAAREDYTGADGISRHYTSGRLSTYNKFSRKYGRFEARIKLPRTQGLWPAFWLMGSNKSQVNWPECGEIDIMELVGSAPSTVLGTIHGPGHSGSGGISSKFSLPDGKRFSDDLHTFAVEWEKKVIRFYVDDTLYATRTQKDLPKGARWVYDHPFFIILDLAVGGNLPGNPDETTEFPQKMSVDYVRVYSR